MTRLRYTVRQNIPTGTPGGWPPGLLLLLAFGMLVFGCCWLCCAAFAVVRLFGL